MIPAPAIQRGEDSRKNWEHINELKRQVADALKRINSLEHPGGRRVITGATVTTAATIRAFKIRVVNQDYFTCRTLDQTWDTDHFVNSIGGSDILVAKPFKLRGSIAAATYDDVDVDYEYADSTYTERDAYIDATWVETQIILPRILVPSLSGADVILATEPEGGTGVQVDGAQLTWQDLNVDGRAWARKFV